MNAKDSIFLPRFTIGENAFDAFHDEMGRYGKKVAVIHGDWKRQVLQLLQNGCMDMMQPMKTLIRSQMIRQYRKQICSLQ